jgi:hypothetical protein
MNKPKKDPVREDRIHNEAIADANGPEEQVMGWYYYLEDKIRFPFQAKCIAAKVVSPLRKGETVEAHPRSGRGKPSKPSAWHLKTPAPPTC